MFYLKLVIAFGLSYDYAQQGADWDGLCETGYWQSPVDLTDAYEAGADDWTVQEAFEISLSKVSLLIMPRPQTLLHSAHFGTFLVYQSGIEYSYIIKHIEIKHPSEHTIDGVRQDIELQIFSQDQNWYNTVSIFFDRKATNTDNAFMSDLMQAFQEETILDLQKAFGKFETIGDFWYYLGSYTHPPCFEEEWVQWQIWDKIQPISDQQVEFFANLIGEMPGEGNFRELQPLNERQVYHFRLGDKESSIYLSTFIVLLLI